MMANCWLFVLRVFFKFIDLSSESVGFHVLSEIQSCFLILLFGFCFFCGSCKWMLNNYGVGLLNDFHFYLFL
jgi:hypothetical protein